MVSPPRPDSNSETSETALLEALWRGDELEAMLWAVRTELTTTRQRLGEAEARIAELVLLGDAAQAAIDALRAQYRRSAGEAKHFQIEREALAAELFQFAQRAGAYSNAAGWLGRLGTRLRARWF